jgi:hypothetical protein
MSMLALSSPLLSSGANEVLLTVLQLVHVLILGCWLGAELVINKTYRYAILAVEIAFSERDRMLGQAMESISSCVTPWPYNRQLGFALLRYWVTFR